MSPYGITIGWVESGYIFPVDPPAPPILFQEGPVPRDAHCSFAPIYISPPSIVGAVSGPFYGTVIVTVSEREILRSGRPILVFIPLSR